MHFESWTEFFAMGGYAAYVWWSVAIVFLVMAGMFWHAKSSEARTLSAIKQQRQKAELIKQAKARQVSK